MRAVNKRDYKDEYQKFQSSDAQKGLRVIRNRNRRRLEREGRVSKGDGMDVHHVGNSVRVVSASKNRGNKTGSSGDKRARGRGNK